MRSTLGSTNRTSWNMRRSRVNERFLPEARISLNWNLLAKGLINPVKTD